MRDVVPWAKVRAMLDARRRKHTLSQPRETVGRELGALAVGVPAVNIAAEETYDRS
jgi:hypothetical protein